MRRYETDVRDGVFYVEAPDGSSESGDADGGEGEESDAQWLEVGPMDAIVEEVGGETYELQYDERQRSVGWLDTDEDGTLSFDVRETLRTTTFDDELVSTVADVPVEETNADGVPKRTAVFADLMTSIWDSKGNLQE